MGMGTRPTILVVDGYVDTARMLAMWLQSTRRYRAEWTTSVNEAIYRLENLRTPDLVIVDMSTEGFMLAREIKQRWPELPVIGMTGRIPIRGDISVFESVWLKPTPFPRMLEDLRQALAPLGEA